MAFLFLGENTQALMDEFLTFFMLLFLGNGILTALFFTAEDGEDAAREECEGDPFIEKSDDLKKSE